MASGESGGGYSVPPPLPHPGLPEVLLQSLAVQLASSLSYLHSLGWIYCDLKPENVILLQGEGGGCRAVLFDFDLCQPFQPQLLQQSCAGGGGPSTSSSPCAASARNAPTLALPPAPPPAPPHTHNPGTLVVPTIIRLPSPAPSTPHTTPHSAPHPTDPPSVAAFWGTLEYVAPEVLAGGGAAYSPCSDWWALGCLLYEAVYHHSPFHAPSTERIFYNITNRAPEFPPGVQVGRVIEL